MLCKWPVTPTTLECECCVPDPTSNNMLILLMLLNRVLLQAHRDGTQRRRIGMKETPDEGCLARAAVADCLSLSCAEHTKEEPQRDVRDAGLGQRASELCSVQSEMRLGSTPKFRRAVCVVALLDFRRASDRFRRSLDVTRC